MLSRFRWGNRSRGQGLVELVLVLPVLAIIFMSILQFGVLFSTQLGITNAVREAVRNASAIPVATLANAGTAAQSVYTRLTDPSTGLLERNGSSYSTGALVTAGSPTTQVCYYSYTDATGGNSIMARVQVVYDHPLFIPLISGILDGFDGITNPANPAFRLVTSEEIRVANGPLSTTNIPSFPGTCKP